MPMKVGFPPLPSVPGTPKKEKHPRPSSQSMDNSLLDEEDDDAAIGPVMPAETHHIIRFKSPGSDNIIEEKKTMNHSNDNNNDHHHHQHMNNHPRERNNNHHRGNTDDDAMTTPKSKKRSKSKSKSKSTMNAPPPPPSRQGRGRSKERFGGMKEVLRRSMSRNGKRSQSPAYDNFPCDGSVLSMTSAGSKGSKSSLGSRIKSSLKISSNNKKKDGDNDNNGKKAGGAGDSSSVCTSGSKGSRGSRGGKILSRIPSMRRRKDGGDTGDEQSVGSTGSKWSIGSRSRSRRRRKKWGWRKKNNECEMPRKERYAFVKQTYASPTNVVQVDDDDFGRNFNSRCDRDSLWGIFCGSVENFSFCPGSHDHIDPEGSLVGTLISTEDMDIKPGILKNNVKVRFDYDEATQGTEESHM